MNSTPKSLAMLDPITMTSSETVNTESGEQSVSPPATPAMNFSEEEKRAILVELNAKRMQAHIPAMVMVSCLMLVGLVGNLLVVYVYKRRFKKTSSNYFIMTMAVFDLLACLIGMPTELYDLTNPYTFYSTVSCKLLRGCETFTVYGSAVVLVEIAFDRFFKICRPLLRVSLWRIKMLCVLAAVIAVLLSIMPVILYGIDMIDTSVPGIRGYDCSIAERYKGSLLETVFHTMLGGLVFVILFVLMLLYTRIWWEIRRRRTFILGDTFRGEENGDADPAHDRVRRNQFGIRYMPSVSEDDSMNNSVGSPNSNLNSVSLMELHLVQANTNGNGKHRDGPFSPISPISSGTSGHAKSGGGGGGKSPGPSTSLISNSHYYSKVSNSNHHHQHSLPRGGAGLQSQASVDRARPKLTSLSSFTPVRLKMTRTTVVLFAVTVAFVLSYLPSISVIMLKKFDRSLENSQSVPTNALLKILSNSFFINNAINPIIYSFLNVHFRRQARNTVTHIFCCCLRRRRRPPQKKDSDRSTKREFITRD